MNKMKLKLTASDLEILIDYIDSIARHKPALTIEKLLMECLLDMNMKLKQAKLISKLTYKVQVSLSSALGLLVCFQYQKNSHPYDDVIRLIVGQIDQKTV